MATAGHHGTMWLFPVVLLFLQMVQTVIPNACKVNNGNCEQFCKAEDDQVVCSCAAGYALGNDNKTCVPVVKFPCGKLQRNHKASREKVGGTTASPEAHPENEEIAEALSSHPEVTGEADSLPRMVDKDNEEPSRSMRRVEKIIAHAEFDTETFDNDIALLKLEEPITFSEDVVPACLPEEDFAKNVLMNQTFGIVSGFGKSFELGQTVKRMKVLQIPYVDRNTCKLALRNRVTENMFCAGYDKDGEDVCQGDGGGPHVTQYNGTYFATGIISWGEGCGRQGKYGVYTNLSKFLPWIRSVLTENS
ncbi:coagulation factor x-like [Limosa lapponica baueri]|uniref:Vitamin K-dependent protein C n=1 Tax=Limosa lapponica baueri TaxID=1758121 RepID=A0A2I0TYQ9_LIMLA|nr:coagulation factor x-like [Limosa lapponica baueri]